jgi:hypothetical protein
MTCPFELFNKFHVKFLARARFEWGNLRSKSNCATISAPFSKAIFLKLVKNIFEPSQHILLEVYSHMGQKLFFNLWSTLNYHSCKKCKAFKIKFWFQIMRYDPNVSKNLSISKILPNRRPQIVQVLHPQFGKRHSWNKQC